MRILDIFNHSAVVYKDTKISEVSNGVAPLLPSKRSFTHFKNRDVDYDTTFNKASLSSVFSSLLIASVDDGAGIEELLEFLV